MPGPVEPYDPNLLEVVQVRSRGSFERPEPTAYVRRRTSRPPVTAPASLPRHLLAVRSARQLAIPKEGQPRPRPVTLVRQGSAASSLSLRHVVQTGFTAPPMDWETWSPRRTARTAAAPLQQLPRHLLVVRRPLMFVPVPGIGGERRRIAPVFYAVYVPPNVPSATTGIAYNEEGFTYDHPQIAWDGEIVAPRKPFLTETAMTSVLGDRTLANQIGVDPEVIDAFRSSVPYWKLKQDARKVATGLGLSLDELRAAINEAEQRTFRGRYQFPSSRHFDPANPSARGFGKIRTSLS